MEITASDSQTVATNGHVLFDSVVIPGSPSIIHRAGSGLVTLRGLTNQCRARFRVTFSGNIGVPTGGTAGSISIAIAQSGEALASNTMITTTAAGNVSNVSTTCFIEVPAGCCTTISVLNNSTQSITTQNVDFIVERVA